MKFAFLTRRLVGFIGLAASVLSFLPTPVHAAFSCSVAVTPISVVYDPTVATENITTGTATISCTRAVTDANTFAYTVAADNGLHLGGGTNRVQLGANRYNYELYRLSPYINGNRWQPNNRMSGTVNFGTSLSASDSKPFDLRVPGSQTVVPAGTYTDTVTVTLRDSVGVIVNTTAFGVSVTTTNSCQLSSPPGSINFTYSSFQGAAASASTTFSARCTSALPYTLGLDAASGTLLGLNYSLSLSQTAATGTGVAQSFTITGNVPGGQSGTCPSGTCTGSQSRTLTVTY